MISTTYKSTSSFRNDFSKIIGVQKNDDHTNILKISLIDTPIGAMLAIADEAKLYLLKFSDCSELEREIQRLCIRTKSLIIPGNTAPITSIETELKSYFKGDLKTFKTHIHPLGSSFQVQVWKEIMHIPYGTTRSYGAQAEAIRKNKAYRAVANAHGANQFIIIIPCHRIIKSNGDLGGYSGGADRKKWLIDHEHRFEL